MHSSRQLKVPEGAKDVQAFDASCPSFGLRKQASGHASYFVKYSIGKQQRRKTLGPAVPGTSTPFDSQAGLLSPRQGEAGHQRGRRGKARQEAELRKTLGKLVPTYLALREKGDEYWPKLRPRSLPEVTRYLTRSWQPLHGEPIDKITRQMVRSGRDEIVKESGAVSANRAMGRSALRLGHRSGAPHARQPDGGHQAS